MDLNMDGVEDVGEKREESEEEMDAPMVELEEEKETEIDPYHTWFNKRVFTEESKVEADDLLYVFLSF